MFWCAILILHSFISIVCDPPLTGFNLNEMETTQTADKIFDKKIFRHMNRDTKYVLMNFSGGSFFIVCEKHAGIWKKNIIWLSHDTPKIPCEAFSMSISYSYCVCLTEYVSMNKQWFVDFQGVFLPVIYLRLLLFHQIQKLERQEPPGLFHSRFFVSPFYFFIYPLIFNLQGRRRQNGCRWWWK